MSGSISTSGSVTSGNVIGSGPDTLILRMSGDSYGPSGAPGADAQFTVNIDGQQLGGVHTVSASHAAGEQETFTFQGDFAPGPHDVTVTFTNNVGTQGDKTDFGRGGDRNLYVDSVTYNGQTVSDGTTPIYTSPLFPPNGPLDLGNAVFSVNDTTPLQGDGTIVSTTPGAVDVGSGADTLTLYMSEDPYQGDAQFTVAVDGQQVGGTLTATAIAWQGQTQPFNLHGDWGAGEHTVTVTYLSDRIGAMDGQGNAYDNQDQNLFVNRIVYNGVEGTGTPWELANNGSHDFHVPAGGQAGTYTPPAPTVVAPVTDKSDTVTNTGTQPSGDTGKDGEYTTITPDSLEAGQQTGDGTGKDTGGMTFLPPDKTDTGTSSGPSTETGTTDTTQTGPSTTDNGTTDIGTTDNGTTGGGIPWSMPKPDLGSLWSGQDWAARWQPGGSAWTDLKSSGGFHQGGWWGNHSTDSSSVLAGHPQG